MGIPESPPKIGYCRHVSTTGQIPNGSTVPHTTMSISTFFSSLVGTLHADAPQEENVPEAESQEVVAVEEQEEEEPEDVRLPAPFARGALPLTRSFGVCQLHPKLREEAQESSKCKAAAQHFSHCQEKVQSGKGFLHEDCVEEMYVLTSFLSIRSQMTAFFARCTYFSYGD
jgi:ubiquinol-cytochrome c reductase subunit 6